MKNVVLQLSYELSEFLSNYLFMINATGMKTNYLYFVKFLTKNFSKMREF